MQILVTGKHVRGWDDPRLPTLAGMRRRGISPTGINLLCHEMGITRSDNKIPLHRLYHHVRMHLDETTPRALAVLRPLRLVRPSTVCAFSFPALRLIICDDALCTSAFQMMLLAVRVPDIREPYMLLGDCRLTL